MSPRKYQTADERREAVLDAAVLEFSRSGFHGASTAAIARSAGISQPYVYALFAGKKALFTACMHRVHERIRAAFATAAIEVEGPEARLKAMGAAYGRLLTDPREMLLQHQACALATQDEEIRAATRAEFLKVWETVRQLSGAPEEDVLRFMAAGMLLNVAAALDLPAAQVGEQAA